MPRRGKVSALAEVVEKGADLGGGAETSGIEGMNEDRLGLPIREKVDEASGFNVRAHDAAGEQGDADTGEGELMVHLRVGSDDAGFELDLSDLTAAMQAPGSGAGGLASGGVTAGGDGGVRAQVCGSFGLRIGGKVGWTGDEPGQDLHEGLDQESGVAERSAADDEVEMAVAEGVLVFSHLELDLDAGVTSEEGSENGACDEAGKRNGHADAQEATGLGKKGTDGEVRLLGFFHDAAAVVDIKLADFGERDAAGGTFDEADTEAGFEAADGAAEGGLGNPEALGGAGKAARTGDGDEIVEFVEIRARCSHRATVYLQCQYCFQKRGNEFGNLLV